VVRAEQAKAFLVAVVARAEVRAEAFLEAVVVDIMVRDVVKGNLRSPIEGG